MTIELRVLGSLSLRASDGKDLEALVRQSKRTALLAYLALARPRGFHRRDRLLALFWPELPEARARGALNQALYVLRTALGEDAMITRGDDEVGLNGDVVRCDAIEFETALNEHPDQALALYRGDLLEGFFVSDSPGFEQWLETERARLRQRASEGAWSLAEQHAKAGRAVDGARWARRAADFTPTDEGVARRLMTFLHRVGDRAAAIRAYEAFAWQLSKEYELEPSSETRALSLALREDAASVRRIVLESAPAILVTLRRGVPLAWATAFLATTILGAGAWTWLNREVKPSAPVMRFALGSLAATPLPGGVTGSTISVSPDGRRLVFVAMTAAGRELLERNLDALEPALIPNTRGAYLPFFSPDGNWVGFVADGSIRKVSASRRAPIVICQIQSTVYGASWGFSDVIVFATGAGLWRVAATGGTPHLVAVADTAKGVSYRWPVLLQESDAAVFTISNHHGFELAVVSLKTGEVRRLGVEGTNPHFLSSGHLVFGRRDGVLFAVPFDTRSLDVTGRVVPVQEGVVVGRHGAAKLGVSSTGTFAYVPEQLKERALVTVDRSGREVALPVPLQGYHSVRYSHEGERVAVVIDAAGGPRQDIWVFDQVRRTLDRLTDNESSASPVWTADDKHIVFATWSRGQESGFAIKRMPADRRDSAQTLMSGEQGLLPLDVVGKDSSLIFQRRALKTNRDIWHWRFGSPSGPEPVLRTTFDERAAAVSPEGDLIAYKSDESGRDQIFVKAFPASGPAVRVSVDGGHEPRWARGGQLFYRSQAGLVTATVSTTPTITVHRREVLFDASAFLAIPDGAAYDVHPDGQRFVLIRRGPPSPEMVVVVSLFDHVLRSAPSP